MGQLSEDDNPRIVDEHVSRWISTFLRDADVNQERTKYLSNYRNVLNDLPNAKAEDWDLAAAVVVQIISSNIYGNTIDIAKFQEASLEHIERLIYETDREQPKALLLIDSGIDSASAVNKTYVAQFREANLEDVEHLLYETFREPPKALLQGLRMPEIYKAQPRLGTYIYSRIAMAILTVDEDPNHIIRRYEEVLGTIRAFGRTDIGILNRSLVRGPLQNLYDLVKRYEEALNLSIPSSVGTTWVRSSTENDEDNARRFIGWMMQLLESGAIADTKRFLDLIYVLIKAVEGVDREAREQLSNCPKDTRQYWAWFYGYALGSLLVEKPSLRQSLLYELDADEWSDGWPSGGILFESDRNSWGEYREWALRFYYHADIEHRVGPYTNDHTKRTSSGDRQPPHLSAQSDLYWAMRVGFADAHIESGEDGQASLQEMANTLGQVKDIISSSALHTLRIEMEMDQHWQDISQGLPPTAEHWREWLQGVLANVWDALPEPTIQHLVKALDRRHARDPDGRRVATGQAVESLLHELVIPEVQRGGENGITIEIHQRGGTTREYHLDGKRTFQMSEWAQMLGTLKSSKEDSPLGLALNKAFPKVDVQALIRLSAELRRMSNLRGRASHHSRDYWEWKAERASEFWDIVVGGVESTGFLEKLCTALGLVEREPGQSGKGGGTVR